VVLEALASSPRSKAWAQPVGAEFQVNTYVPNNQFDPTLGPDGAGGFVVVWESLGSSGSDSSGYSVAAQRYDSTGMPVGGEFQVNTYTTSDQSGPGVAPDGAGGFVVVWESRGSTGSDSFYHSIQARRFASTGTPIGAEFQVNTYTTNIQAGPAVAPDGAGGFVVVWSSAGGSGTDTSPQSIQGQRFASTGTPIGSEFQVNSFTPFSQTDPAVAPDGAGGFVVAWTSQVGLLDPSFSVQARRFTSAGAPVGAEFRVNTYTTGLQLNPAVGPDGAGGFVIVWEGLGVGPDDLLGVQGQRYANTGAPVGGEFQINTYTTNTQRAPAVGPDGAGGFVVTWEGDGSGGTDTSSFSIQGQRFHSTGAPIGAEFQVNTYTTSGQFVSAVGADGAGGFVVVWGSDGSSGSDTSASSVQGQRFSAEVPTTTTSTSTSTTTSTTLPDHYKCYKSRASFQQRSVTLADQFGQSTATVLRPDRLCNPVNKNGEGIADPDAHLNCYRIREPRGASRDVVVANQFGELQLTTTRTHSLCVPAIKDQIGDLDDLDINHFTNQSVM